MANQFLAREKRGIRVGMVADKLACSRPTVWRNCREIADFPKPYKISPRVTLWDEAEVDAFMDCRRDQRATGTPTNPARTAPTPPKVWPEKKQRKPSVDQRIASAVAAALAAAGVGPPAAPAAPPHPPPPATPIKRSPGRPRKVPVLAYAIKSEATS
jgi:predicted DNA-binding transcriptional regulator AlpA